MGRLPWQPDQVSDRTGDRRPYTTRGTALERYLRSPARPMECRTLPGTVGAQRPLCSHASSIGGGCALSRKYSIMPPQPRHRAQAKLELEITAAEAAQEKWRGTVSGLRAAGHQARREEGILRSAK